jgi:kynurenine aminotransferase
VPPDCINLGQGFMNWAPAEWIRKAAHKAMDEDVMVNHYAHPRGRPRLVKAISDVYSQTFPNLEGRKLKPEEIVVTAGANGGESAELRARRRPRCRWESEGPLADNRRHVRCAHRSPRARR